MVSVVFFTAVGIVTAVGTALVYWVGGTLVFSSRMTTGTIIAFVAYLSMIYGPISSLVNSRVDYVKSMVSFERVFEVLDLPIEIVDPPEGEEKQIENLKGEIKFENVSFSYYKTNDEVSIKLEEQSRFGQQWSTGDWRAGKTKNYDHLEEKKNLWVLRDVTIHIEPGQMVALVGRSGAGKTTCTYLLPRLYDVNEGRIMIDGVDIRDLKLDALAGFMGMVTQDVYLFHDSIRENLLYAKPNATDSDLEQACKAANIWNRIQELPEGLDTVVGEHGFKLSGGEKQRVSIARTILRDPKILVLDEATSSLDSESESLIQDAMEKLFTGKTSLVIAHRLSTILKANKIIVLDKGKVVEEGTHNELLQRSGIYAMLYNTQFKRTEEGMLELEKENKLPSDKEETLIKLED